LINRADSTFELSFESRSDQPFEVVLMNELEQKLVIGFDPVEHVFYIDRKEAGKVDFKPSFANRTMAEPNTHEEKLAIRIIVDVSSVEVFADHGMTVMSSIFFPDKALNQVFLQAENGYIENLAYYSIPAAW
jgi:fructan beta-fructosidase